MSNALNTAIALTPYKAAGYVNAQLKEAGLSKSIPPQMMYNYTTARVNAGKAPLIKYTPETGVDREDLERWTKAYVAKNTPVKEDPDQLELEFEEA